QAPELHGAGAGRARRDRLGSRDEGAGGARVVRLGAALLALSLAALVAATFRHARIVAIFQASPSARGGSPFGPLDAEGAFRALWCALLQASVVLALGLTLALRGPRRSGAAGALAPAILTVDLALANARDVLTLPQALFETTPKVVRLLDAAERDRPEPGPFRIHRMPIWSPSAWMVEASPDRVRDLVGWERDSLQPKYGITYGYQYTLTLGVAELYDYEWFFGGFLRTIDEETARALKAKPGQQVVVYPRRAFDLWNTRYFIIPVHSNGWADEERGYASFLPHSTPIYPAPGSFDGPGGAERREAWAEHEDFQILRNEDAFPRAWVVHAARYLDPVTGMGRAERDRPMQEILFANDPLWSEPGRPVYDPHERAWVESDKRRELLGYLPGPYSSPTESVTIAHYSPQRVEIDAVLDRPGLVVLADIDYPGWRLTIDGAEAPIYRANRLMRGAAVKSGRHRLVYTYEPRSFHLGGRITLAGLAALIVLGLASAFRPVCSSLARDLG
ncbi:MAG: hypothetical protein ACM35G_04690, partial [Planctomycetaceae bacterium]